MADERDFRLIIDLTFPPALKGSADQLRELLLQLYLQAVVINEGLANEERGFIDLQRCGHRLGLSCETIGRWEVGKGRVI